MCIYHPCIIAIRVRAFACHQALGRAGHPLPKEPGLDLPAPRSTSCMGAPKPPIGAPARPRHVFLRFSCDFLAITLRFCCDGLHQRIRQTNWGAARTCLDQARIRSCDTFKPSHLCCNSGMLLLMTFHRPTCRSGQVYNTYRYMHIYMYIYIYMQICRYLYVLYTRLDLQVGR